MFGGLVVTLINVMIMGLFVILSIRKHGFILHVHGICIYLLLANIVLYLSKIGYVEYAYLQVWSTLKFEHYYTESILGISLLVVFYNTTLTGLGRKSVHKVSAASFHVSKRYRFILISFLIITSVWHIVILDLSILWANTEYLLIASSKGILTEDPLSTFIHNSTGLRAIIAVALFAYLTARRRWLETLVLLPIIIFFLVFQLASHSRLAVVIACEFGMLYYFFQGRSRYVVVIASIIIGIYSLSAALIGRGIDHHGISTIFSEFGILDSNFNYWDYLVNHIFPNFFEGVFVTTEIFGRGDNFDTMYKNLSFSPFPSFIDGFSGIREHSQIRLHEYVPMGAILEVYAFGPAYLVIFFAVQFIVIRQTAKRMIKRASFISLAVSFVVLFSLYLQFTYPVRNVFRFLIIAVSIMYISRFKLSTFSSGKIGNFNGIK